MPQMGAMVEVLGSALHTFRVFTDEKGFYSARNLCPAPTALKYRSHLSSLMREHVGLHAGTSVSST